MNGISMMKPMDVNKKEEMTIEETLRAINDSTILNQFASSNLNNFILSAE